LSDRKAKQKELLPLKMVKQKSDTQKHTPKLTYTQRGKPLTEEEFDNLVREADESGYLTPEEFKKKCQILLNFK
jgi:Ca2+-binding EF-hand superfamily protein